MQSESSGLSGRREPRSRVSPVNSARTCNDRALPHGEDSVFRTVMAAAAAVLVLVSLPAEAQWKWKDTSGRIQYSDLPPPAGTPDQDILSRPTAPRRCRHRRAGRLGRRRPRSAPPWRSSAVMPKGVDPELEAKRKKAEDDVARQEEGRAGARRGRQADNCSRAQTQLRDLESGLRVIRTNEKGEREYLDDKQRAEETKHAKDMIAADCRSSGAAGLVTSGAGRDAAAPPSDPSAAVGRSRPGRRRRAAHRAPRSGPRCRRPGSRCRPRRVLDHAPLARIASSTRRPGRQRDADLAGLARPCRPGDGDAQRRRVASAAHGPARRGGRRNRRRCWRSCRTPD
mgnify:CR=1 FL=1